MMKANYLAVTVLTALATAGCADIKELEAPPEGQQITITAAFSDEGTRTVLKDESTSVYWEPGDEIKVFYGSNGSKFTSTLTEPSGKSDFSGELNVAIGSGGGLAGGASLWGVYPYSEEASFDGAVLTAVLPSTQTARAGSFPKGANISVAKSNSLTMGFYNVCGGLRFTLTQSGIKEIIFDAIGFENIAGTAKISFEDGVPAVREVEDGHHSITLCAPDGETFETGKWYYISALPATLQKGFKMTFCTDSQFAVLTSDKAVTVKRRVFGSLEEIDKGLTFKDKMEYVDLGLSVKWATCNLGAASPEQTGGYYAWGETEPKTNFEWSNYKWCNGTGTSFTKYNTLGSYGPVVDYKTVLDPEDDAAHVALGGCWRIPTESEFSELLINSTCTETTLNEVKGMLFTSKVTGYTDKSIFIPYCGFYEESEIMDSGSYYCMSSSLIGSYPSVYYHIYYSAEYCEPSAGWMEKYNGLTIRPVFGEFVPVSEVVFDSSEITVVLGCSERNGVQYYPENATGPSNFYETSNPEVATVSGGGIITGVATGSCTVTVSSSSGVTASCTVTVTDTAPVPEAVDLGLSVKWASMNLMASKPERDGAYFAWGETEPKSDYSWATYKWCSGTSNSLTKYNTLSDYGTVDGKSMLDLEDDAAHVKLGGEWRMPTLTEWEELRDNCYWTYTVEGYLVTSKKQGYTDKSIFLPMSGFRFGTKPYSVRGYYRVSTIQTNMPCYAHVFYLYNEYNCYLSDAYRYYGFPIRPVCGPLVSVTGLEMNVTECSLVQGCAKQLSANVVPSDASEKTINWSSSDEKVASVNSDGLVTALSEGSCTITASARNGVVATCAVSVSESFPEPDAVDLGLSVKWASFNLGAAKPEDYGGYYAWGETEPKSDFTWWDTYKYCNGSFDSMTKYCVDSNYGTVDNKTVLEADDDAAHVKLGGAWRMPTDAEWTELRENCIWTGTTLEGVKGSLVTSNREGYTDKSIFLPAAGYRYGTYLYNVGSYGIYWSSSLNTGYSDDAWLVLIFSDYVDGSTSRSRCYGQSVRPVTE